MRRRISYWLMPSSEYFELLQDLIRSFAEKYQSQVFEPHVTVYSGAGTEVSCRNLVKHAVIGFSSITLEVEAIDFSLAFFKTLFIAFTENATLSRLSERFRLLSGEPLAYQLNPHLSLIYKEMNDNEKQNIASTIRLPWDKIEFDWIKAISTPVDERSAMDVSSWRDIIAAKLSK